MKPLHTSWKQRKATTSRAVASTPQKAPPAQIKAGPKYNCYNKSTTVAVSTENLRYKWLMCHGALAKKHHGTRRLRKHATSTPCHVAPLVSGLSPITHTSSSKAAASDEEEGDPLDLGQWGLPAEVVAGYAHRGVRCMFPWQLECLRTGNVLAGAGNLVYSAPTSAGKTLVAEILMLKRILETKTKALLVLPFVSLAREKELALAELFGGCGVRVGGFLGQRRPPGGLSAVDLAVCTIERANGLLNGMLLDQGTLGELGILVVDELHLVGDAHRGYLLELMLTKVAYAQKRGLVGPWGVQVVAMSATLANLGALARWLGADLYQTDFRPVPLRQLFKLGQALCEGPNLRPVRHLPATSRADDPEGLLALCLESWVEGHALLVFCPTRRWCEALAASLARCVRQMVTAATSGSGEPHGDLAERLRSRTNAETGKSLVQRLRSTPGAMDPALASCLSMQVAFHHAGLTLEERDLLEGAFREGAVRALVATTTLSSGVNLPARRVIIRSANFQGNPIDSLSYHQMVGRAGRMGLDTQGESILMCRDSDRSLAQRLSRAEAQPITSCLTGSSTSLRRALLEVVASGVASSPEELSLYTQCTLRHHLCTGSDGDSEEDLSGALRFLVEHQLVHLQGEDGGERRYHPSQLGQAALASGLSPDDALAMVGELERARRCLALDTDLHLVYLVTPAHLSAQLGALDWGRYQELWERLSAAQHRVAGVVGVDEACVARAAAGRAPQPGRTLNGCRRFYLALALEQLASERPLAEVAHAFALPRGLLQSLQQGAATFAGMVCVLCQRLGWRHLQLLVAEFQARLHFGVQPELCALLALPSLDGPLARLIFDAGFANPSALAQVAPPELDIMLRNAGPFQGRGESRCWQLPAHGMVTTTQLADILVREARAVVEGTLGVAQVAWGERASTNSTAASPQNTQADTSTDSSEHQETRKPKGHGGNQVADSPKLSAGTAGPNSNPGSRQIGSSSSHQAAISPKPLRVAMTPHALPGKQENPASSKSPKEEASEGSEYSGKHRKGAQGMPVSLSLPWPSLPPGGTVAHLEPETHDSDDEERLTLDGILGSLPIASEKSPEGAHRKSTDSPVRGEAVVVANMDDDAILLWEENSSPLALSRAKQINKPAGTPSDTNSPSIASPKEVFYQLSGSFAVDSEALNVDKENVASPRKSCTPAKTGAGLSQPGNSGAKNSAQKAACTSLIVSPLHSDRALRSEARNSCANGKDLSSSTSSPKDVVEVGDSFDFGSSFFPSTMVARASRVRKSPPLTLLRSRRHSAASKSASLAAAAASPPARRKKDSYRFSGSFVLDSQTLKAMDGVTCGTDGMAENATASSSAGDENCGNISNGALCKDVTRQQKSPLPNTSFDDVSSAACSLGSSTLSELFGSPGNDDVPKSENNSPASKRSSSGSSGSATKSRKRSASDGELFSSTEDSDLSLDSLADRVREGFTWERVECVEDFTRKWEKKRHFSMSVAVQAHAEAQSSIGFRRSTRLVAKLCDNPPLVADGKRLVGIAICWEDYKAHFLPLESTAPPLLELLSRRLAAAKRVVVPDVSQALRFLARPCGLDPARLGWEEPHMAHWLLDPSRAEDSLADMVNEWAPHLEPLLEGLSGIGSVSVEEASARLAVLVLHLQKPLVMALKKANMYTLYREQEVRFRGVLCKMDLIGLGYDPGRAQQTVAEAERALSALQADAWALAGQPFMLSSARQVDAIMKARVAPLAKGSLLPSAMSSRATLTHLASLHPLPAKVIDWRKLHAVVIKNLRPIGQHQRRLQPSGGASRIRPWSQPWTATGRVMVTEPNLQGIAKNFTVCTQPSISINARAAFRPSPGAVLMSADYSQLELRLLAHLSRDEKLCEVFRAGGDVFRRMAALWSHCDEDVVDASLRQRTKQICYGITYGQGAHSLAQQLGVERAEADAMIGQFRQAFPGLQRYSSQLVERARITGEVRTLLGRRRPLTNLRSVRDADRAKAERQALSTAVQGSAADLLRRALLSLDDALAQQFPECQGLLPEGGLLQSGAFMVLQLHDELLLEVCQRDLHTVSAVVRECMEGAVQLSVPLAVRIRTGPNWADLDELRQD